MTSAFRKAAVGFGAVVAVLGLSATSAFANDCFNASRNPNATPNATPIGGGESVQGHWVNFGGEGWGFGAPGSFGFNGNFTNGKTDALVANAAEQSDGRVCETPNRVEGPNLHGVQSPEACGWE
jgi:hypothetical protein